MMLDLPSYTIKKKIVLITDETKVSLLERIDHSIIHIKETMNKIMLDVEVEQKKQGEFRKYVLEFTNSYNDNSFKHYYSDSPLRCSHMVSKLDG